MAGIRTPKARVGNERDSNAIAIRAIFHSIVCSNNGIDSVVMMNVEHEQYKGERRFDRQW